MKSIVLSIVFLLVGSFAYADNCHVQNVVQRVVVQPYHVQQIQFIEVPNYRQEVVVQRVVVQNQHVQQVKVQRNVQRVKVSRSRSVQRIRVR